VALDIGPGGHLSIASLISPTKGRRGSSTLLRRRPYLFTLRVREGVVVADGGARLAEADRVPVGDREVERVPEGDAVPLRECVGVCDSDRESEAERDGVRLCVGGRVGE
jgi:hypothetical protein